MTDPGERVEPLVGEAFDGRYEVLAPISSGAMGAVYRAMDREQGQEVAVKRLDAIRVGPSVTRGFAADGDRLEILVFSPSAPGDAELVADFFSDG